jgi:hypothetical protein
VYSINNEFAFNESRDDFTFLAELFRPVRSSSKTFSKQHFIWQLFKNPPCTVDLLIGARRADCNKTAGSFVSLF